MQDVVGSNPTAGTRGSGEMAATQVLEACDESRMGSSPFFPTSTGGCGETEVRGALKMPFLRECEFESHHPLQRSGNSTVEARFCKPVVVGSNPTRSSKHALVAQRTEQQPSKLSVTGSIPVESAI